MARSSRASLASGCCSVVGGTIQTAASAGGLDANPLELGIPAEELEATMLHLAGVPNRYVQADGRREHSPVQAGSD
jgi:hypothetical protein